MAIRSAIAALLASLLLPGCAAQEFVPTRVDPTPFEAADGDCWNYAGTVAPDDHTAMYAKCMARHGWTACGPGGCGSPPPPRPARRAAAPAS